MKFFNKLNYIKLFICSLIFLLILALIIYIIYIIFDPIINLCDDNGLLLYEFNLKLNSEYANINRIITEKKYWYDEYQKLHDSTSRYSNPNIKIYKDNYELLCKEFDESTGRIDELRRSIKRIKLIQ